MTRLLVAGTPDTVATSVTDKTRLPGTGTPVRYQVVVPGQQFFVYLTEGGADRITDLLDSNSAPITMVTADDVGQLPAFALPDGLRVDTVWLDPIDQSTQRFAVPVRFGPAAFDQLIQGNPQVLAALAALVQSDANLATSQIQAHTTYAHDVAFIGDKDHIPSKVGFDDHGEIAEATMVSAQGKGMARVIASGNGVVLVDSTGKRFALGFGPTGQFDDITKWALVNLVHSYVGPDRPFVWPGNFVEWTQTDSAGNRLGTFKGVAT